MKFYTTVTNSRGLTKGIGGGARGQVVHVRGWDQGVKVISTTMHDGSEQFDIYLTGGSNSEAAKKKVGFLRDGEFFEAGE